MSTQTNNQNPKARARSQLRRRIADQTAAAVHQTAIYTLYPRTSRRGSLSISAWPILQRILAEAPQVAANADAVRVGHSPTGRITVIAVHGPDWSLIASGGRPVPDTLLVVMDDFRRDYVFGDDVPGLWGMRDRDWLSEIARAVEAIHHALTVRQSHNDPPLGRLRPSHHPGLAPA